MTREEFLGKLRMALVADRISNVDSLIDYYDEMICDRIEDGMDEEAAVEAMGTVDEIVKELSWDKPIHTLVKEKVSKSHETAKSNGKSILWIILLLIGSPVWVPIAISILIVLAVLYMVPWIFILSFFIVLAAFGISAVACAAGAVGYLLKFNIAGALIGVGGALVFAPLCVMLYKPIKLLAKATLRLGAGAIRFMKRLIF